MGTSLRGYESRVVESSRVTSLGPLGRLVIRVGSWREMAAPSVQGIRNLDGIIRRPATCRSTVAECHAGWGAVHAGYLCTTERVALREHMESTEIEAVVRAPERQVR